MPRFKVWSRVALALFVLAWIAQPSSINQTPSIATQITLIVGATDIGSTGTKACATNENAGTITAAHLIADLVPTGADLTIDVLTVAFGSYTGYASASSITAAAVPVITTVAANPRYSDTTLTGWTTAIAANTVVCVNVKTAPTGGSTFAALTLKVTHP